MAEKVYCGYEGEHSQRQRYLEGSEWDSGSGRVREEEKKVEKWNAKREVMDQVAKWLRTPKDHMSKMARIM